MLEVDFPQAAIFFVPSTRSWTIVKETTLLGISMVGIKTRDDRRVTSREMWTNEPTVRGI